MFLVSLGAGRGAALLAEVLVQVPCREDQEQPFPRGSCDLTAGAVEQRGIQRSELIFLISGLWSGGSSWLRRPVGWPSWNVGLTLR